MGPTLQAQAGIAVAPLKQEISLKPGEEGKIKLTLSYNKRTDADVLQKMRVTPMDVQATEDGSLTFKDPGTLRTSASKWISLDAAVPQMDLALDPGQTQSVECTVKVPMSAASGEYYAAVMVTLAQKGVNEKGVAVQYRIASGVFVTVLGRTFAKEAKITQCELVWPTSSPNAATQPATQPPPPSGEDAPKAPDSPFVRVVLQNTGLARFDGSGRINVFDLQGRMLFATPFTSKRPTIFGGDTRLFEAPITRFLPAGKYTIRVEMDYQSPWAKARQEMHVEVLPSQAELLAELKKQQHDAAPMIEAAAPNILVTIPAGGSRSLAIALKDISEGTISCKASTTATTVGAENWFRVAEEPFTITKGAKKTLVLKVDVPATAAAGKYSSIVTVEASTDGAGPSQISIPVDIDVKAGR